jgi:hypothetical protein
VREARPRHLAAHNTCIMRLKVRARIAQTSELFLEAVMNSIRNGLGMRKAGNRGGAGQPENPLSNAVFTQVHNTL